MVLVCLQIWRDIFFREEIHGDAMVDLLSFQTVLTSIRTVLTSIQHEFHKSKIIIINNSFKEIKRHINNLQPIFKKFEKLKTNFENRKSKIIQLKSELYGSQQHSRIMK